jgi:hypothetical protein
MQPIGVNFLELGEGGLPSFKKVIRIMFSAATASPSRESPRDSSSMPRTPEPKLPKANPRTWSGSLLSGR